MFTGPAQDLHYLAHGLEPIRPRTYVMRAERLRLARITPRARHVAGTTLRRITNGMTELITERSPIGSRRGRITR